MTFIEATFFGIGIASTIIFLWNHFFVWFITALELLGKRYLKLFLQNCQSFTGMILLSGTNCGLYRDISEEDLLMYSLIIGTDGRSNETPIFEILVDDKNG